MNRTKPTNRKQNQKTSTILPPTPKNLKEPPKNPILKGRIKKSNLLFEQEKYSGNQRTDSVLSNINVLFL